MLDMWKLIRIWILSSWSFLTIGILLGSWWAYHELGWGGWWFWDPVENASLMPWLMATACIHSITKPKLNYWTVICTIKVFILSILGTFFVRSGLLSSVHSFATDSTRGLYLLLFLLFLISISVFNWISLYFKSLLRTLAVPPSDPSVAVLTSKLKIVESPGRGPTPSTRCFAPDGSEPRLLLASQRDQRRYPSNLALPWLACFSAPFASQGSARVRRIRRCLGSGTAGSGCKRGSPTIPQGSPAGLRHFRHKIKRSLEQILFLQNFYLSLICIVVFCGTSAPILFHWIWNKDVGTGAPFYNATLIPLFTSIFFVLLYVHYTNIRPKPLSLSLAVDSNQRSNVVLRFAVPSYQILSTACFAILRILGSERRQSSFGAFGSSARQANLSKEACFGLRVPQSETLVSPALSGNAFLILRILSTANRRLLSVYIFFFFVHVVLALIIFGLNTLNSVYCAICFLLISSIIISTKKRFFRTSWPDTRDLSSLPSRHFDPSQFQFHGATQETKVSALLVSPKSGIGLKEQTGEILLKSQRNSMLPMNIAHAGIVLFIMGTLLSNTFKSEFTEQLHKAGASLGIRLGSASFMCYLRSIDHSFAPTFHSLCANLLIYQQSSLQKIENELPRIVFYRIFVGDSPGGLSPGETSLSQLPEAPTRPPRGTNGDCKQTCALLRSQAVPDGHEVNCNLTQISEPRLQAKEPPSPRPSFGTLAMLAHPPRSLGSPAGPLAETCSYQGDLLLEKNLVKKLFNNTEQRSVISMFPEKRFFYSNQGAVTTKVAIHSNLFTDFYSLIGTGSFETGWFTTIMKLPFIFCIWMGFLFGVVGGFLSLNKLLQKSKLYWL